MDTPHQNARVTVPSREQIVARVTSGRTAAKVAAAFAVSARTLRKWLARFRAGGQAALSNRASARARDSGRLDAATGALIGHLRRTLRMTEATIAARLGLSRSTIARWLRRQGLGRSVRIDPPAPVRRNRRERPGALIRRDIKKRGRFDQPGHCVTGTRVDCRNRGAGWDFVHVAVDEATRLAYVEVLDDERKNTTTGFPLRALRWFRDQGIRSERAMTDAGSACRSRRVAKALWWMGIRHSLTRPYAPRTNGKDERFIRTHLHEWAHGLAHPSSSVPNADLPSWLGWFDRPRPHSPLAGRTPGQRVNHLVRTHIWPRTGTTLHRQTRTKARRRTGERGHRPALARGPPWHEERELKGHGLLLACARLLAAGSVPAEAVRAEDNMGSAAPKLPCSEDPPETGSACPGQTGMDPAES